MMWFMDFNRGFLELVANNPEDSVTKCAKQSYKTNLGIHHPYTIRQAASLAMHTMSGRTLFIPKLIGGEFGPQETKERIMAIVDLINPVKEVLWRFYAENNLEKLP
mmetsp:Transcript_40530/g.46480  ORF Transcript_40530/g.46480 Transcript_40530/m.46480 type:complete len:106 (-) Transcript_40530:1701-2018(-)